MNHAALRSVLLVYFPILFCLSSCGPLEPGVEYVDPRVYNVDFTFELQPDPDSIDRATDLKLWLPAPREWDSQKGVKVVSVDPPPHGEYTDPEFGNRMFFWDFGDEQEQAVYSVNLRYRVESFNSRADIVPDQVGTYDTTSEFYSLYTRGTDHIEITPEIRALALEAVGDEQNPYWQAKRIHDFVVERVKYERLRPEKGAGTRALLSTAVIDEQTGEQYFSGECNQMTEFFVALCRSVGIPARAVTGMVGWGPWMEKEDLKLRGQEHTQLSSTGLAAARLFGPLGGHRWAEFFLPTYGWIPVDPTWDRFGWIGNQRVIFSKGTDVLIGPDAPPGDGGGYGDQWIPLHEGRVDAFGWGVWNLARVRVANAKVVHHSDPFPADALAGYPVVPDPDESSAMAPTFDGRDFLRSIDELTRSKSEKRVALAEAYEQEPWLQEGQEQFLIHMLRVVVGDEAFFETSRTYEELRTRSGEPVPTRRFQEVAEEIHSEPLDWFFSQWLEGGELPQVRLEDVETAESANEWLIQGNLRQLNDGIFRLPVEIEITTERETWVERVWMDAKETPFQFRAPERPKRILVDPSFNLLKIQKMPPVLTTGYPEVLVVYGTLTEGEANRAAAEDFERGFLGLGHEVVKADIEVSEEDLNTPVLILFGRPETNRIAQRFAESFPVRFDGAAFTFDGVTYQEATQGVSQVIEKPDGLPGLMVLHAGLSGVATRRICDKAEWRESLGGWFLVDLDASYVIYDAERHQRLASGVWEGYDPDLVWEFVTPAEGGDS